MAINGLAQDTAIRPQGANSIVITLDDNYPPYVFRDSNGALTGYLVDYWQLWERKAGVKVTLEATDWEKAKALMQSGSADVIDTIFQTPQREITLDFTAAYAQIPVSIYSDSSLGGISDVKHLEGFVVGVKAGDACIDNLEHAGIHTLKPYANYESLVKSAISGGVKIFCMDEPPANYFLYKLHGQSAFNKDFTISTGEFHRAVHKGDVQTTALLEHGFSLITDMENLDLRNKWMGTKFVEAAPSRYLLYGLGLAALGGGGLLLWGSMLRSRVNSRTKELEAERTRLRVLLQAIPDLVWLKDADGIYRFCNPTFESFFGAKETQIIGRTDYDFVERKLADYYRENDLKAVGAAHPINYEEWVTFASDGRRARLETTKTPVMNEGGELIGVLGISRDITERSRTEEQIRQLAFFDPLTQLPNRRLLADRLNHALVTSMRTKENGALLFIDLDHFKTINDTLGHAKGDLLLREYANRIVKCVRQEDTVARLGGDEFVVMIENLSEQDIDAARQVESVGEKILAMLEQPLDLDGVAYQGSASIGIASFRAGSVGADELMKRADLAMYQAKAAGRNCLRFFDPKMQSDLNARAAFETEFRSGLQIGQFLLHYQPQVDNQSRIVGAESLVRWLHPERGLVPPGEFISLAEDSGLILPLGKWVIESACDQLVRWSKVPKLSGFSLSVNVSAKQFYQNDFVIQVLSALDRSGADPRKLEIELTESVLVTNVEATIEKMQALKAKGIRFSLDDFGTGFSSLSYLSRLPLDQLKIDRSFVSGIEKGDDSVTICAALISLAHSLKLKVVAEGVETEAQRYFLSTVHRCDLMQGFLYSRPLAAEAFESFVPD